MWEWMTTFFMNYWQWIIVTFFIPFVIKPLGRFLHRVGRRMKKIWKLPDDMEDAKWDFKECIQKVSNQVENMEKTNTRQHEKAEEERKELRKDINEKHDEIKDLIIKYLGDK